MDISKTYNPYKLFIGSFIPNWLLCRTEISQGAKLCFARLAQYAGEKGLCYPSTQQLGCELGVTRQTIAIYLKELKKYNIIDSKRGRNSNHYYFLMHKWMDSDVKKGLHLKNSDVKICLQQDVKKGLQQDVNISLHKENHVRESYKRINKENTKRKDSDILALKFYAHYPLKKKPTPTRDAFYKRVKNMTKQEAEEFTQKLIDALSAQLAERALKEREGAWMPQWREPPAWLNQAGWEDEVNLKIGDNQNERNRKQTAWDHSQRVEAELAGQKSG